MSHQDDDEIVGLSAALRKLPAAFRPAALNEFKRAFLERDYANFRGPEIIHYSGRTHQKLSKALIIVVECENFIFDLFFVPVRKLRFIPVVGRAYFVPASTASLIN